MIELAECVALKELIETVGEERTKYILEKFTCSREKDEELFLHDKAIIMEKKHSCRTYLFFQNEEIIGFFTVGLKCTTISDNANISRRMRSRLSINPSNKIAQCFLLAQLCRSDC